jgi:hypothetical protein
MKILLGGGETKITSYFWEQRIALEQKRVGETKGTGNKGSGGQKEVEQEMLL